MNSLFIYFQIELIKRNIHIKTKEIPKNFRVIFEVGNKEVFIGDKITFNILKINLNDQHLANIYMKRIGFKPIRTKYGVESLCLKPSSFLFVLKNKNTKKIPQKTVVLDIIRFFNFIVLRRGNPSLQ